MVVTEERSFPSESPVCTYWLARCEGFTVRAGRRVVGVVEEIAHDRPLGPAERLVVRDGRRQTLLRADAVQAVVPGQRLVIAPGRPTAPSLRVAAVSARRRGIAGARAVASVVGVTSLLLARLIAELARAEARGLLRLGREARRQLPPTLRRCRRRLVDSAHATGAALRSGVDAAHALRLAMAEPGGEPEEPPSRPVSQQ